MTDPTTLALAGFTMIIVFMYLIMSKRMSAMNALILIPIVFAIGLGFYDAKLGKMMFDGVKKVAPTGIMICFAILFFGIMIDAGLFDPIIGRILRAVHGDPMKVCVGTAILAAFISLDGDGSTTYLVTCSALLAVHRRLGINPIILPALALMENSVMNIIPWGGPTGRVLASLNVEASQVFVPMVPGMVLGTLFVCFMAYRWGVKERARLGVVDIMHDGSHASVSEDPDAESLKRPEKFWINAALVVVLMFCLIKEVLPLAILFIIGTALALLINYRNKDQQARIAANGANAMPVVAMVFAAGIFMGILADTKMVDAMAKMIIAGVPESMGPHFAFITSLISLPGTFFMTNDAFYFGVLPVLAKAAATYGIDAAEMGRAALIGQGAHLLSPLVPSTYLLVGLNKVEFGDLQRFALLPAIGISLVWLATAMSLGYIHF
ncbi:CitMHS family transporter [Propionivibrio soli]|uniref:CitMHS family transporter n=1 Tax=Propionivibrio soli TaxID=2976531 RepID=UPI0021E7AD0A|nr:citrate:proton symporter [Propionivibrio soli]